MGDIADAPHETAAVRADAGWVAGVFVCLWLAGCVGLAGRLDLKQDVHAREGLASVALGEEAVVTDAPILVIADLLPWPVRRRGGPPAAPYAKAVDRLV